MTIVAVVSGTTKPDQVVMEAARQAENLGTGVHVLYILGLSWYSNLEVSLSERIGIPTKIDTIRGTCEQKAEQVAEPVLDEYEAVGIVGRPVDEIVRYARKVEADLVILDAEANWGADLSSLYRDPIKKLQENDIPARPVY